MKNAVNWILFSYKKNYLSYSLLPTPYSLLPTPYSLLPFKLNIIQVDALGRVLVVVYTWRGDQIRLISARKATPTERFQYLEG
ncbi:MAG: BrnT family toxin [Moorea sp. SIO3G5]|nr:BrnT family toxin [Moorena sp. SIO3G5]